MKGFYYLYRSNIIIGILILSVLSGSLYAGNSIIDKKLDEIRSTASGERPYIYGSAVDLTIVPGKKSVILKCSKNQDDIEEIYVGSNDKYLYIYCLLSTGGISGGGSTYHKSKGSFRQVGGSVAIGSWRLDAEKIHIRFQLSNDDKTIVALYKRLRQAGRFSKTIKNWGDILDDPEMIFPRLTESQRVECFTRMWCVVKYNFANFDLVPELNWDEVLHEYIPKVIQDQSNIEYQHLLQECMGKLKDGHSSVMVSMASSSMAQPAVQISSVGGRAIISKVAQTAEMIDSGVESGDEITHVDGEPVLKLLERDIFPYISASTAQWRDLKAYPQILQGAAGTEVSVRLKKYDGSILETKLKREANGRYLVKDNSINEDIEIRHLENEIVYVALNSFGSEDIVKVFNDNFDKIKKAKGLILDVRNNGGGSSSYGHAIISHLIRNPIPKTRWKTPQYRPAFVAWGRNEPWYDGGYEMIEPSNSIYDGPVVVLAGPRTFSAAEDFVVPLHAAGRAVIVGEKTGGSTGQPLRFSFMDGTVSGRVCTKRDQYPDGRDFVGVGVVPDVEIHPTVSDIIEGRDPVLSGGLERLKRIINGE